MIYILGRMVSFALDLNETSAAEALGWSAGFPVLLSRAVNLYRTIPA
jgi:hypothetical protein